jgi:hypothetical protein
MEADGQDAGEQCGAGELAQLRNRCRRQAHEIQTLLETIEVLRAGANSLAADNAILRAENATMQGRPPYLLRRQTSR